MRRGGLPLARRRAARPRRVLVRTFDGRVLDDLPHDVNWLLTLQCVLEAALATNDVEIIDKAARLLTPYAGRAVFNAGAVMFHGLTDDTLARAAAARGDPDTASRLRDQALATYERLGAQWWRNRLAAWIPPSAGASPATPSRVRLHPTADRLWLVGPADTAYQFGATRLRILRELLRRPGQPVPALDLVAGGSGVRGIKQASASYSIGSARRVPATPTGPRARYSPRPKNGPTSLERDALHAERTHSSTSCGRGPASADEQEPPAPARNAPGWPRPKAINAAIDRIASCRRTARAAPANRDPHRPDLPPTTRPRQTNRTGFSTEGPSSRAVSGHVEQAVARGHEPVADVAHEDGQLAVHHVEVDKTAWPTNRGRAVQDPGPPDLRRPEVAVAGDPRDPVVLGADRLRNQRCPASVNRSNVAPDFASAGRTRIVSVTMPPPRKRARRRSRRPSQLVEVVERVVHRHLPDLGEPGTPGQLPVVPTAAARACRAGAAVRERRRHAVQDAETRRAGRRSARRCPRRARKQLMSRQTCTPPGTSASWIARSRPSGRPRRVPRRKS